MNTIKILFIEDEEDQQGIFRDAVEVFKSKNDLTVEYETARGIQEAEDKLNGSFDGAIIDLKLGDDEEGGNEIVHQLEESFARIPVIFVTAFPDSVIDHPSVVRTRSRDKGTYESDLQLFQEICDTGLTRIMGGRGFIEKNLSKVFLENLLPQMGTWVSYGKEDSARTERALLRHTLNHLSQLLDDEEDSCYPEEMYLAPPLTRDIRTGSIVKEKQFDRWFAVMNPACDLVFREKDKRNTDMILVVEVDRGTVLFPWFECKELSKAKQGDLRNAFRNNKLTYYHWLPKVDSFPGGFLNFRKLSTLENKVFLGKFNIPPQIQIAPSFIKDVIARFSSYYARQGQPDIDYSKFLPAQSGNTD